MIGDLPDIVLSLFLIFCRVGTCLLVMPGISSARIPAQVRLFLSFAVSLALAPGLLPVVEPLVKSADESQHLYLIFSEAMVGFFIGILGRSFMLALSFGPTFIFLLVLGIVIWRERKTPKSTGAARALEAVFQGAGIANLVLALVFAYGAHLTQSITVWLYHPVVVCVFQGVAWYVAWIVRKRAWLGLVSLGWFAVSLTCGLLIQNHDKFLLTIGVALILLMALPGYAMRRAGKQAA